jgi:hypothetical protein
MSKFEKNFRNLPWAGPSANLRERIFTDARPKSYPVVYRFFNRATRWAAVWILTGSIIGYCVGRGQNQRPALIPSPGEVIVVETDTETNFFNQTGGINEVIPGKWVLNIEPEGGIQG